MDMSESLNLEGFANLWHAVPNIHDLIRLDVCGSKPLSGQVCADPWQQSPSQSSAAHVFPYQVLKEALSPFQAQDSGVHAIIHVTKN